MNTSGKKAPKFDPVRSPDENTLVFEVRLCVTFRKGKHPTWHSQGPDLGHAVYERLATHMITAVLEKSGLPEESIIQCLPLPDEDARRAYG